MEEALRLAELAERLRAYKASLAYSYCFITWASLMVGLPLAFTAIMFSPWSTALMGIWHLALASALGAGLLASFSITYFLMARLGAAGLLEEKWVPAAWSASFAIPHSLAYGLLAASGAWQYVSVIWYPAGAIAFISVGLTVERVLVERELLLARPFLTAGLAALLASGPVLYLASDASPCGYWLNGSLAWAWEAGPLSAMLLASAVDLLVCFAAALYTLLTAERAIFGHGAR